MDDRLHKLMLPRVDGSPGNQEVRRFNDMRVQSAIDDALARIEENSAIIDVDLSKEDGETEIHGVAVAKLGGHWSVGLIGEYKDPDNWLGGVHVGITW